MNERKVFPIIFEYIIFFVVVWRSLSIYTIFIHKKVPDVGDNIYVYVYKRLCVYKKTRKTH